MTTISETEFHAADGVDDWRCVFSGPNAHFRTGSFAASIDFVSRISELVGADDPRPDIDVRDSLVALRFWAFTGGLTTRVIELAREISAVAHELGLTAQPETVQHVQFAVAHPGDSDVMPFWEAVLGYERAGEEDLIDPRHIGPTVWFMELDAGIPKKRRVHVDISVAHDQAEARIAAAVAAGGRIISDKHAPAGVTLADPQGHYADIATWQGRD